MQYSEIHLTFSHDYQTNEKSNEAKHVYLKSGPEIEIKSFVNPRLKLKHVRKLPFYKYYNTINLMINTTATKKKDNGQNLQTTAVTASLNALIICLQIKCIYSIDIQLHTKQ